MKQILLFFTLSLLLPAAPSFAKGHGGHGGGHSHSHSGGAHSGSVQSSSGFSHTSGMQRTATRSHTKAIITRSTSPGAIAANHARSLPAGTRGGATAPARTGEPANTGTYAGSPGYYYPYYVYYASPFFYDPYYMPFICYYGFMYTPNYAPLSSPRYANTNDDQLSKEPMDGFVVFYNDTLSGAVTVGSRAVSLETTDSGKDYDYRFHEKDKGLQYVTVYNEDDKQLNFVRLNSDYKKLWRVVHIGKLNIYDSRRGFIYKPEDIDIKTLTVEYKGAVESLNSYSATATKEWLAGYVNQAYGSNLDPKKFSWKELLIYVDKLD